MAKAKTAAQKKAEAQIQADKVAEIPVEEIVKDYSEGLICKEERDALLKGEEYIKPVEKSDSEIAVNDLITEAISSGELSQSVWGKTGDVIHVNKHLFATPDAEKKVLAKEFTKLLNREADTDDLPETGQARNGEVIELRKTNNKIKWSSWVKTARMVQNTSDIFAGIELLGYEVVFPKGVLMSRYELLKLIKDNKPVNKETAAETIIRCLELVNKKIAELDKADADSVDQRLIETSVKFATWKTAK